SCFLVDVYLYAWERNYFRIKPAFSLSGRSPLLAYYREFILLFATNLVSLSNYVGRLNHRHPERRFMRHQPFLGITELVDVLLYKTDRFDAASNDYSSLIDDDPLCCHTDSLKPRAAKAIDSGTTNSDGQTSSHR